MELQSILFLNNYTEIKGILTVISIITISMSNPKERVLFWLEDHTIHFGIAKYFGEKYNCDLYAIISTNSKAKKFYKEQKIIDFKKTWYYRDFMDFNDKTFDIDYLKSVESTHNISIWKLVYGERFFHNYTRYHVFNDKEILSIIYQELKLYEQILDEINPDFVILRVPEYHDIDLFYQLCRSKGIKTLILDSTRFGFRSMISEESDLPILLEEYSTQSSLPESKTFEELRKHLQSYSKEHSMMVEKRRGSSSKKFIAALKFFFTSKSFQENFYQDMGKSKPRIFFKESMMTLTRNSRKRFIDKNFVKKLKNDFFIYFPLHFEPERTLLIKGQFYTYQKNLIKIIAQSLPVELKLYVKEHPAMKLSGWRDTGFYKEILKMPNVVLIHPSISNEELIKNCQMVITIAGTSGLEAAFYNKPSIILTDVNFKNLSCITRLYDIQKLPETIRISLKQTVDLNELNQFVNKIDNISFTCDLVGLIQQSDDLFALGGFLSGFEISSSNMEHFLKKNKEIFEQITIEHIKKIEMIKKQK